MRAAGDARRILRVYDTFGGEEKATMDSSFQTARHRDVQYLHMSTWIALWPNFKGGDPDCNLVPLRAVSHPWSLNQISFASSERTSECILRKDSRTSAYP